MTHYYVKLPYPLDLFCCKENIMLVFQCLLTGKECISPIHLRLLNFDSSRELIAVCSKASLWHIIAGN